MLWSDPAWRGNSYGARLRFHLLLVGANSGGLIAHISRRVVSQRRTGKPRDRRAQLAKNSSRTSGPRVIRFPFGAVGFCLDHLFTAEFLAGMDRRHPLGQVPRRRQRGSAGKLRNFRALAKDQTPPWYLRL